jgi:hypothetical protein
LALVEVERVDPVGGLVREAGDAAAEAVVEGELVALGGELGLLGLELVASAVDFGGSSVEFFHVDVAGLVEVGDPSPLGGGFVDAAGESVELGVQDFVVGGGLAADDCLLTGEQHVGAQQDLERLPLDLSLDDAGRIRRAGFEGATPDSVKSLAEEKIG